MPKNSDPVFLITGASTGIGAATARACANLYATAIREHPSRVTSATCPTIPSC